MKTAANLRIVHESETQRQHVRLPLSAKVRIGDKKYTVRDISSGGISISDVIGDFVPGRTIRMQLKLPFEGFSLETPLEGEVKYYNAEEKILGCSFINLSAEKISLLNSTLKSFLAGEIVNSNDMMNVVARNNFTKPRQKAEIRTYRSSLIRQLPGLLAVGALGTLVAVFVAGNLFTSLFIVKASDAAVSSAIREVHAPAEGVFHQAYDPDSVVVDQNQTLGTITPANGQAAVSITSPCHCYIAGTSSFEGEYLNPNSRILSLVPLDAKPWITAKIDPAQAAKIAVNTPATIRIFGSKTEYSGHIASIESGLVSNGQDAAVPVATMHIIADQKIPVELVNRPASVSFGIMSLSKFFGK